MTPRPLRFSAALAAALLSFPAAAATFYASPTGDDAGPGTAERPVRTLARAQALARAARAASGGDVTILLQGGVFRLDQPLVLDARDSGDEGRPVTYAAAPGQRPVLSGGLAVTGWKLVDPQRNLWAARAPDGLADTRQLYVDGARAGRAEGRLPVNLTETASGYRADSPAMAGWRNPADIEFVYTGGNALWSEGSVGAGPWTEPRCPVAAIVGPTITMAQPAWNNSTRRVKLPPQWHSPRTANLVGPAGVGGPPVAVENAFELLGTPGQFYFDRPARTIYYVPRAGEDLAKADVEAPALEQLIVGAGTEADPLHDVTFRGLQFSYATWLLPNTPEGFSEIQANLLVTGPHGFDAQGLGDLYPGGQHPFGAWTMTPGNVAFRFARRIRFERDAFVHLGAAGLQLGHGSQEDAVVGCVFTDISANGLELGGVDLPEAGPAQLTRDNRIADNHLANVAAEYHGGVGILVGYAQRTRIEHNQLDHLPYTAISIGWGGWPDKIGLPGVANNSAGNVIARNLIFDHLQLLADGGGIYTQGLTGPDLAHGEQVIGNVVRSQYGSGHAIYSDNGSCNMTVAGNVMFQTNFDNWGSRHKDYYGGGRGEAFDPLAVRDNWWQQGDPDSDAKNVVEQGNHLVSDLRQVPADVIAAAGLEDAYKDILDQRFAAPGAPAAPAELAAAALDGAALVAWCPPNYNGGSAIVSYTVISSQGPRATIANADFHAKGYAVVKGLANGRATTFTVASRNAQGFDSPPSLPSRAVTPAAASVSVPGPPAKLEVRARDGRASVHFRAPVSDGGSPITAYVFIVNPGNRRVGFGGRTALVLSGAHETFGVVDGLQAGRSYTIGVAAINAAGEGPAALAQPFVPEP
jgi:hypothetical protein